MTDVTVLHLAQSALMLAVQLSAPLLGLSLAVGLMVSIVQAATQIQESSLVFVAKLGALGGALVAFGPWLLHTAVTYTTNLLVDLPRYVR